MPKQFICLDWVKGKCSGDSCPRLHQVPDKQFDDCLLLVHDCFGRERSYDIDKKGQGIGSFAIDIRTLRLQDYKGQIQFETEHIFDEKDNIYLVCFAIRSTAEYYKELLKTRGIKVYWQIIR